MIYVDPRVGSGHYVELLRERGVEADKRKMQFGDLAFVGNGPGQQLMVGIEVKKPGDLISSLISKRLSARQLPGLMRTYDVIYLATIGRMKAGNTGGISTCTFGHWTDFPTKLSWGQLQGMLSTFRHHAKIHLLPFDREDDFVLWVTNEYKWWQRPWESHTSHIGLRVDQRLTDTEGWMPSSPKLTTQVASLLPGIGDAIARTVGKVFSSVEQLANADVETWERIPGIGKKRAAQAWLSLRGE